MSERQVPPALAHWKQITLGELFSVSSGEGLSQAQMRPGYYAVYGGNGITGFHDRYMCEDRRLIIGRVGEYCGNVHVTLPQSWVTDNALIVAFCEKSAYLPFWFYFLNQLGLNNFAFAAAQPVITGGILSRIIGRVPPLSEQRKIAKILSTLDDLIEKTEALIAKYQAMTQGMMLELFARGVDAHGHLRPPSDEAPDLYKQSEMGWIPKEWEVAPLGNRLISIEGGWSPDCIEQPPPLGEWGVLKVSAVSSGEYAAEESKTLPSHLRPDSAIEVRTGDVLLARSNGVAELVGVTVQVDETRDKLMLSDKVLRLNPDRQRLHSGFLALIMKTECTRKQVGAVISGSSGQRNISQSEIRNLIAVFPPLDEQQRIYSTLRSPRSQAEHETRVVAQLRQIKTGLMQDLLTGRVRVKVDETEDAAHV
jgi:restriction endonuclease S subunit